MNECVACMKKKDVPSIAKVFLKIYSGTVGGTYQFFVCTFLTNLNVSKIWPLFWAWGVFNQ